MVIVATAAVTITLVLDDDDDPSCGIAFGQQRATTRPPGCAPLSDADAAWEVDRTWRETRPGNAAPNSRRPTAPELARFRAENESIPPEYAARVTGNYSGTTDDVIEWAAWKWGIDENVLRAQALQESFWNMSQLGDAGQSFGLMQIKRTVHHGTFPLSAHSTAFNVDYAGALFRYYYDGRATWLERVEHGEPYERGDLWGAVGAHFAGRWHTPPAEDYVAKVQRILAERSWPTSN